MPRVDRLDERKPPSRQLHLVGLQVADQVPFGALDGVHLRQRLLDPVLAKVAQSRLQGLRANLGTEPFGDRDDRDLVRIASRASDALADRTQPFADAHRKATIAPNRVPSGWRRCEGNR